MSLDGFVFDLQLSVFSNQAKGRPIRTLPITLPFQSSSVIVIKARCKAFLLKSVHDLYVNKSTKEKWEQ